MRNLPRSGRSPWCRSAQDIRASVRALWEEPRQSSGSWAALQAASRPPDGGLVIRAYLVLGMGSDLCCAQWGSAVSLNRRGALHNEGRPEAMLYQPPRWSVRRPLRCLAVPRALAGGTSLGSLAIPLEAPRG
jgi:hypothetical protein